MNASLLSIGSRPSFLADTRFRRSGLCQILPPHLLSVSPHTGSLSLSDQDGFLLFSCFWIFVVPFLSAWHNLPILNRLAQSYVSFRHWLSFSRNASDSPVWVKCFSYNNLMAKKKKKIISWREYHASSTALAILHHNHQCIHWCHSGCS